MITRTFDSTEYKEAAVKEWQKIAPGWHKWRSVISDLTRPATDQMLSLAGIGPGSRVLDITAGDGNQSIMAARRVGPEGYVLATDISSKLLAYTAASAQEAGLNNLETQVMDAGHLELKDNSFDAVICRLGLMLLPDVGQAMSEIYRVLKRDGRAAAIVFTTPDKNPWMSIPAMIALKHAQLPPPQPGQPGLFSLGSNGVFEGAFQTAGFREVEVHRVSTTLRLSSASECARLVHDTAGAIHTILSPLHENGQQAAWNAIQETLGQFEGPDGFESPCEFYVGAGMK